MQPCNDPLQPCIYLVSSNPNQPPPVRNYSLTLSSTPPVMQPNPKLTALKNPITAIGDLWRTTIRPYLNDSEFVEIQRTRNILDTQRPRYGQSIVDFWQMQDGVFSRAYYKLLEILHLGVIDKYKGQNINIACLAEGPGGFMHCIRDYRHNPLDKFSSITLKNPSHISPSIHSDWSHPRLLTLLSHTPNPVLLSYGSSGTGDLTLPSNLLHFSQVDLQSSKCELVTADGGIECISDRQYNKQEVINAKLFFAEVVLAVMVQKEGGCFVMKVYGVQWEGTKQILQVLADYYGRVCVVKPRTSRPANSERYLLCEGFKGITHQSLTQLTEIFTKWTQSQPNPSYYQNNLFLHSFLPSIDHQLTAMIDICNRCMDDAQSQKLEQGLKISKQLKDRKKDKQVLSSRMQQQIEYAFKWCKKYDLRTVLSE